VRVLEISQVRSVGVLLVDLVTESRCRLVSLLVAVHEQHSERDRECHLSDRASQDELAAGRVEWCFFAEEGVGPDL